MRAVQLAFERTSEQDPKYPIRLLVDVAIKALSPAINDPTTAVQAIDQIEDLLRRLGGHDLDAGYAHDADGVLRLIFPMPTWEDYLVLAFDEIRHCGFGTGDAPPEVGARGVGRFGDGRHADRGGAAISQATRFDCRSLRSRCG